MFIKLTRLDNKPVWINASFIVTVEPRRDGHGAVVVPIGDGLDYVVKESVDDVLRILEGAPAPTVVPVPVSDCLTKTPEDVSPEPEPVREERRPEPKPAESKPAEPRPAAEPAKAEVAEKKPRKRTTKAKPRAAAAAKKGEAAAKDDAAPADAPKKAPVLELSDDQVTRLAKLAPKTVAKLKNTLASQFRVADVGETVMALESRGAFRIDGNRVLWTALPAAPAAASEAPLADW